MVTWVKDERAMNPQAKAFAEELSSALKAAGGGQALVSRRNRIDRKLRELRTGSEAAPVRIVNDQPTASESE
ncbi:MAG: hypothetical protein QOJ27_9 [Sphingomonadales bacterium]|nr:hypothetical protein [Sphingomonadales bacterium]